MIRRDFLQAEIAKLAQALAKIMALKKAGNQQEAADLIDKTLHQDFDADLEEIINANPDELKKLLAIKNYPTEKLDLFAKLLLESVTPFQHQPETVTVLNHVLIIYQLLENEHHTQSFENLNQQQIILQFLQQ